MFFGKMTKNLPMWEDFFEKKFLKVWEGFFGSLRRLKISKMEKKSRSVRGGNTKPPGKGEFTKSKNWCFTEYTQENFMEWKVGEKMLVYTVFQLEKCPETGRLHYQGFIHLRDKKDRAYMRKHYTDTAHWDPCDGSPEQNITYCTKEESRVMGPWEIGDKNNITKQGERSDLTEMLTDRLENAKLKELVNNYGDNYIKNWKSIEKLCNEIKTEDFTEVRKLNVKWFFGEPGTGKSQYAFTNWPKAYRKDGCKWWDGYNGQDVIIFEDINVVDPGMIDDWLKWCDIYPWQVQVKGGFVNLGFTQVIFTSNKKPEDVFGPSAMIRRIHEVYEFKKTENVYSIVKIK